MSDVQFGALMATIVAIMACVTAIIAIILDRWARVRTPMVKVETGQSPSKRQSERKRPPRAAGKGKSRSTSESDPTPDAGPFPAS
jgi:hypothetical protein